MEINTRISNLGYDLNNTIDTKEKEKLRFDLNRLQIAIKDYLNKK